MYWFVWAFYNFISELLEPVSKIPYNNCWIFLYQSTLCLPLHCVALLITVVLLSTNSPKAYKSSGHFVPAADCDMNNEGNPSCLIIANTSFLYFSKYAGELQIV